MHQLDNQRVGIQLPAPGPVAKQVCRNKGPVDIRPGGCAQRGVAACHQRAVDELHKQQYQQALVQAAQYRAVYHLMRGDGQLQQHPHQPAQQAQGAHKMDRQRHRIHGGIGVVKARFNHDPADSALQAAQHEQHRQRSHQAAANALFQHKYHERHQKHQPHQPRPLPVQPLPEEDRLVIGQRELAVELFKLGDLPVMGKALLPGMHIQWRERAQQRGPLRNAEAAARKPRNAAEQDLHHQHRHSYRQPGDDRAVAFIRFNGDFRVCGDQVHGLLK